MTFIIKKPIKSGDIVTLKLTSAEEVIARLDEETVNSYRLNKPMTLSYTPQGVGLTPWLITAEPDATIEIEKSRIMALTNTTKQAADQYIQGTTGIKVM
jgi:hypothetical protein